MSDPIIVEYYVKSWNNLGCFFLFLKIEAGNDFLQFVRCIFIYRFMKMIKKFILL